MIVYKYLILTASCTYIIISKFNVSLCFATGIGGMIAFAIMIIFVALEQLRESIIEWWYTQNVKKDKNKYDTNNK